MKNITGLECLIILAVIMLAVILALTPLFEARAFNKFTDGPRATYWDALWTQLRVTQ